MLAMSFGDKEIIETKKQKEYVICYHLILQFRVMLCSESEHNCYAYTGQ
jgi:hypothetical protein